MVGKITALIELIDRGYYWTARKMVCEAVLQAVCR